MSMLENIRRGRESKPPRILAYGVEGVGKSTFAAAAPNPIFVQTEDGLGEIVPILCSATPNTPFSMILPCFRMAPKRHVAERTADTSPFSLHDFSGLTKAIPPTCRVCIG